MIFFVRYTFTYRSTMSDFIVWKLKKTYSLFVKGKYLCGDKLNKSILIHLDYEKGLPTISFCLSK